MVDVGLGNHASVIEAFQRIGASVEPAERPPPRGRPKAVVLPGVGAFGDGMAGLERAGWIEPLRLWAAEGMPILGICLGMQLLADGSEEGGARRGLGLVPGRVERLLPRKRDRVPRIGWCDVHAVRPSRLFGQAGGIASFYFAHSYHLCPAEAADVTATVSFDGSDVVAAVERGSVTGVQFHPEKSQDAGLDVLEAFVRGARAS